MPTPTIFISYRREDSAGQSGRIFDRLVQQFGKSHVYRDIDTITAGEDFVDAVREKINQSDILLALIGPRWLTAADEEGRWRLADENDLVRIEIATALDRNMRVIPVLLQGASIPKAKDLPGEIARLAQRNAIEIRDTNFDLDTEQLIAKIGSSWRNKFIRTFARWPVYAVIALLLASPLGLWIYPQVAFTPEKARIQIVQMGVQYDADTFVEFAKKGDIQVVKLFLQAGMDPNAKNNEEKRDEFRQSAVMWAAAQGHLDLVKLLQAKGASLDEAMSWAIKHEQKQVLDFMLASNPGQNAINLGFLAAAGKGAIDIAKTLLDRGADINFIDKETGNSAFIKASTDIRMTRFLLSNGVTDINLKNRFGRTALFNAVESLDTELVELLLANDADVNFKDNDGFTPLYNSLLASSPNSLSEVEVEQRRQEIVRILLDKGANPTVIAKDASWQTALSLAISNRQSQIALLLIEREAADANDQTGINGIGLGPNNNESVLMLAARYGMPDVVKALLIKGAEINAHNEVGSSPLSSAAAGLRGNEIIPILLDSDADAGWTDKFGRNVLMGVNWNSSSLEEEIFKRLLKSGVKVNAVDKNGWTALMHAINPYERNLDFIQQLLRFGADTTMKNDVGDTALAIAIKHDAKKMIHLLETHATNQRKNKKK